MPRRQALRILAFAGAGTAAWMVGQRGARGRRVERSRVLMGTGVHLTVVGDDREASAAAADATLDHMAALEAVLSRHDPQSELARLNATGSIDAASPALLDVVVLAQRVARLADGAFDVTVLPVLELYQHAARTGAGALPDAQALEAARALVGHAALGVDGRRITLGRPGMRVTLDGVAKGYVIDRGVDVLAAHGFANAIVEAGGDLAAAGERAPDAPWRIGVRHPRPGLDTLIARVDVRRQAVATSGDYQQAFTADFREHHILDPRTGHSPPELASATVVAPDAATADALATLCIVLGARRSAELLASLDGCAGYFVAKDLTVTQTPGLALS